MTKKEISNYLDQSSKELFSISKQLFDNPELSLEEENSSALFKKLLNDNGFKIHEFKEQELKYAFYAEYGSGKPVIALLGEYDALPGLSQVAGGIEKEAVKNGAPGHACGHNLIGTAAYGAALAIKEYLMKTNKQGTIRFYGCPQEELLNGKVIMAKYNAFEGCDIAISYHPWNANIPVSKGFLAMNNIKFDFTGKSAHAGQAPEQGRSALDAVELANMGVNMMREHIISSARIHYVITNGGEAPNIVPKEASSWYYVRAPHREDVVDITNRVINCQKGGALMTDTNLQYDITSGCYEILPNRVLNKIARNNFEEMEMCEYTDKELEFARAIVESLPAEEVTKDKLSIDFNKEGVYLHNEVVSEENLINYNISGSSDIGDVSWLMPFSTFFTATWPLGVNAHTWQSASASGHSLGQKGMLYAAKIMAGMAYDLINDKKHLELATAEFRERTKNRAYVSPIK